MKVSEAGRRLIEGFEGCRLTAYFDVVGVPTIGYGHTEGVRPGQVITQAQADQMLADDLDKVYGPGVLKAIGDAPTTQAQFDAMTSLAFNIGVSAFKSSTVCRMHKAGNHTAAAEAFHLWNRAGQRVLEPLTRRRLAEAKLYLSKSPAEDADVVSAWDRLRAIQVILGVKPDADFGTDSRSALSELLQAANQKPI